MNIDEGRDLLKLHMPTIRDSVVAGLTKSLDVEGPYTSGNQPTTFIIHASMATTQCGRTDQMCVDLRELEANSGNIAKLAEVRGCDAGESLAELIMHNGSRLLNWQRAGRLRRLWWAWRGGIPAWPWPE